MSDAKDQSRNAAADSEGPKPKKRRERFHGRVTRERPATCARRGCREPGEFRAPLAPNTPAARDGAPEWQYFCLDHVREFNAGYSWKGDIPGPTDRWDRAAKGFAANAYAGAFADELGIFGRDAFAAGRSSVTRWSPAERDALGIFDLGESASAADIRARYKELVRRYHPDSNGGDRSHEARLQAVLDAYTSLKSSSAFTD
ncbi:J domain-containing protein [Pacificimonas sp. WHA3]|uniref:J domain-containing protein n=1 Tax=Pacificimonas pallii TaxID=2827236 RepID=A0ABS6SGH2_9SPHN|nr:J domain-containing protein [Pacificimonas pallii]